MLRALLAAHLEHILTFTEYTVDWIPLAVMLPSGPTDSAGTSLLLFILMFTMKGLVLKEP